jgi:peptidoglycan/xylan/chitin deacetylase (PgdA/CDA1 family)
MLIPGPGFPFEVPERTLALTYDDGPGPKSLELASFLRAHGIRATFFMVGMNLQRAPDVARGIAGLGHIIGNHTYHHPHLPEIADSPALATEVLSTHRLIAEVVGKAPRYLRAPYGEWNAAIAQTLNQCPELDDYIGPVNWDIERRDWEIGGPRQKIPGNPIYTLKECREEYLRAILSQQRGVVLLHDWSADQGAMGKRLQSRNKALELTKWLVPKLKNEGFSFVALDELSS